MLPLAAAMDPTMASLNSEYQHRCIPASVESMQLGLAQVPPVLGQLKALGDINVEGNLCLTVQKPLSFLLDLPHLWRFTIRLRPDLLDERTRTHLEALERALRGQHGRNVLELIC